MRIASFDAHRAQKGAATFGCAMARRIHSLIDGEVGCQDDPISFTLVSDGFENCSISDGSVVKCLLLNDLQIHIYTI